MMYLKSLTTEIQSVPRRKHAASLLNVWTLRSVLSIKQSLFTLRIKTKHISEFFGKGVFVIRICGTEWDGIAQVA